MREVLKNKKSIMGIACIFIIFYHTTFIFQGVVMKNIKELADIGVDMFLIISGMSMYYSLIKAERKALFYKKRFLRIIPIFLMVSIVWYPIQYVFLDKRLGANIIDIFFNISTISFWKDGYLGAWYIVAIIVCYIIAPYYNNCNKNSKKYIIFIMIMSSIIIRITPLDKYFHHILILISRIPIFLIGMYLAEYIEFNEIKKRKVLMVCLGFFCVGLNVAIIEYKILPYSFKYIVYIPIVLNIIYFISSININKHLILILDFIAMYTLEIYLLHEKILLIIKNIFSEVVIINMVSILITIIGAVIVKNIIEYLISRGKANVIKSFKTGYEQV